MTRKPSTAGIVIMASGAVMLLGSFLDFFKFDSDFGSQSESAWGSGLFPLAIYPLLFALVMTAQVVAVTFADARLPEPPLGFTWKQLHVVLAVVAALIMVGYLILDKGEYDFGAGFFLMFLSAIGLVVGAVLLQKEAPAPAAGSTPPTPF